MSKITIIEGNSNDKDNVRAYMVKGEKGDANTLSIGTVSETETAQATITGDAPNQTLNLGLPKADPNTLSIGTVTKGANASATITGDAPNQTLNLVLPKGDKGDEGDPGFEVPAGSVIGWDSSSTIPEGYEEINKISTVVCSNEEPTDDIKIWLQHQDNLFVKETITTGKYLYKGTGIESPNTDWGYSDYIDVSGATKISVNSSFFPPSPISPGLCFYNSNKEYSSGIVVPNTKSTISLPSGTKYIRYSFLLTQVPTLKISKGDLNDDKILIKSELGDYQEFLPNNYSTEETPIGKWIDGRTLYRKVLKLGALKDNGKTAVKYNVPDMDEIVSLNGFASDSNFGLTLPTAHSTTTKNVNVYVDYNAKEVVAETFSDRTSYTHGYFIIEYVKVES